MFLIPIFMKNRYRLFFYYCFTNKQAVNQARRRRTAKYQPVLRKRYKNRYVHVHPVKFMNEFFADSGQFNPCFVKSDVNTIMRLF